MNKLNPIPLILFFAIATIPILSGTGQPLINGFYISITLLTAGIWLILNYQELAEHKFTIRPFPILVILACIALTTVNLPLEIIKVISPLRADALTIASQTGHVTDLDTSVSYYRTGSQFYAVYGLSLFLLFYFSAALLKAEQNLKIVLWIITLTGGLEALWGIMQTFFPQSPFLWYAAGTTPENYAAGSFSNHQHYAVFLNMCWPVSLVLGLSMFKKVFEKMEVLKIKNRRLTIADRIKLPFHHAVLPLWLTALVLVSVILSGSWAGITVMILLIFLFRIALPFPRPVKIIFSGTIYSALLLYGLLLGVQGIISRSTELFHSSQTRISFWADNLAMLTDHLFTGIGTGAYPYLAPLYLAVNPDNPTLKHIQNDFLELALELGLPLILLFFLWLLAGLISYGVTISRMPGKIEKLTQDDIITIGAFYSLAGFVFTAAVTSIFHVPAMTFYAVVLLSVLHSIMLRKTTGVDYRPEFLFLQKKPVKFVPYKKPGRRRRK